MGKYGTNLEGFGAFEGGVNADKGAPLVSTNSDGQTALLFGPAALREIQAGVANGDFAIPPDAAGDTITEQNPLPYWTFTDVNSAGAITAALITNAGAGSGNVLRFTVASGTLTGKSATLTRYVPVASSASRSFSYYTEATFVNGTNSAQAEVTVSCQYYKQDGVTTTGTAFSSTNIPFSDFSAPGQVDPLGVVVPDIFGAAPDLTPATAPSDAAFIKLTITIATVATQSAARTLDLTEIRLGYGSPEIILTDKSVPADPPAVVYCTNGSLYAISPGELAVLDLGDFTSLVAATSITLTAPDIVADGNLSATGDMSANGIGVNFLWGDPNKTGPVFQLAGTNGRFWTGTSSSGAADLGASNSLGRAGVLVTKACTGQPTTNINGTGNTDAFSDALRNGGLAIDTSNNRGYWYSSGWKYTALTTPSDSRLKEDITEISGAIHTLRQLMPVAFKWKEPEAHGRTDCVADDGTRMGFIADQVATTDLAHWVETLGVDDREAHLVDTTEVLAVNIPQNEMEALLVQALLDIDTRLKALESR